MRKIFLCLSFFMALTLHAQVEVYVNGGLSNGTLTRIDDVKSTSQTGTWRWQGGVTLVFPSDNNKPVIQTGLQYENKAFNDFGSGPYGKDNYKISAVTLPFTLGYKFTVARKVKLQLSAGPYVSMITGGSVEGNTTSYSPRVGTGTVTMCGCLLVPARIPFSDDLRIGLANTDDLKRFNWGAQTMLAVFVKRWMFQGQYQFGLDDPNPDPDVKFRLRTASVNVGYKINR